MRAIGTGALCCLSLGVSIALATPAWTQERVGVATTVVGPVTVTRSALAPAPLKFKDDIFLRDRVTTGDKAITRILLGGRVVVTARERSTLTITEVPGLSTIDLGSGRIAVAVDRTRMKPGERVDVRTPHAVAGVRGTVLIVEADADTSSVTVLKGLVDVVSLDPATGRPVGAVTPVAKHQAVTVRQNLPAARAKAISADRAEALAKEFSPPIGSVAASKVMSMQEELERASDAAASLVPAQAQADQPAVSSSGGGALPSPTRATAVASTTSTASATTTAATSPSLTTSALTTTPTLTTAPTLSATPTLSVTPTVTTTGTTTSTTDLLQQVLQPVTSKTKKIKPSKY
jgi:hypothetical protein